MLFNKKKILEIFILILLTLYSFRSATVAFKEAQLDSYDLQIQWNSAKLFSQKINHFETTLNNMDKIIDGDRNRTDGNYSHLFYIIFYPLTLLDWEKSKIIWSSINTLLAIFIPFLIGKKLHLSTKQIFISILLFFISFPVRSTIAMGQFSLMILFFFSIPFLINNRWIIILSGISYCKYNLGYALFLYYLKNKKYLFYSLIPPIIGWLLYSLITNSNAIVNLFEPIQLTLFSPITTANLNHFFSPIFYFYAKSTNLNLILFSSCIFINAYFIYKIESNIVDNIYKLSMISLTVLIFFPHWGHDYVFLLPLALVSYKYIKTKLGKINIFFITYFILLDGYLLKVFKLLNIDYSYIHFYSHQYLFYVFFLMLIINLKMNKNFNFSKN